MEIYLDGQFVAPEDAKVSVFDHGLLYGDGVFEGIRIYGRRVFRLPQHLERLYRSARYISLEIGKTIEELTDIVVETCRRNNLDNGYIRLVVTRGKGTLGLSPWLCPTPTIFCVVDKLAIYPPEFYENGLSLLTVSTRRNRVDALDPQLKTLNYLNNVLAKLEAKRSGFEEALMLNTDGYVAEASADNVFVIRSGKLLTPATYLGALPGITRQAVLELGERMGLGPVETVMTLNDIYNAEECFLTGTAAEVAPVIEVDGRPIADGKPGARTRNIIEAFRALTQDPTQGTDF